MKILLVGDFSYGSLGLSYFNAFKELNCEVFQFDPIEEYKKINRFHNNRYANFLFEKLFCWTVNKNFMDKTNILKPELVFVIKGSFIFPEALKEIKKNMKSLLINFNPDNPFNLNRSASNNFIRRAIPLYDCYFIWGEFLIQQLKDAGAKKVEYLPFAYDPELHFPVQVSEDEKKLYGSDIAFIGTWDKERERWLEYLSDYDLAIWGNGWEKLSINSKLRSKWKRKPVFGEDFSKICNSSKIILNFIRKQNYNAHNMRTFEVPACKGFMLTTRTQEQCEFFEEEKEMICYETVEELRNKIEEYLPKESLRKKMSQAAYEKVLPHTYTERAKFVLNILK